MNRATPKMREFARRLVAYEYETGRNLDSVTPAATFLLREKLGPYLTTLMGNAGFRALLARALVLASEEVAWLRAVQVETDGSIAGLEERRAQLDPAEFLEGGTVLLAQLLGLLVAFIGENLTLRLVGEVWPETSRNTLDSNTGDRNEQTKQNRHAQVVKTNHDPTR